jgi:hypothetical protein
MVGMAKGIFKPPNSVRSLRRYWKNRAEWPDPKALVDEISKESDRASIILLATMLDDCIIVRLANGFGVKVDSEEFDHIFRYEGPLGSFSSRTEIASLFKIIDEATFQQLHCMREMRNACAHTKRPISFNTPEIISVARRVFAPRGFTKPIDDTAAAIRIAFGYEMIALMNIILRGYKHHQRIEYFKEYAKSVGGISQVGY